MGNGPESFNVVVVVSMDADSPPDQLVLDSVAIQVAAISGVSVSQVTVTATLASKLLHKADTYDITATIRGLDDESQAEAVSVNLEAVEVWELVMEQVQYPAQIRDVEVTTAQETT